MHRRRKQTILQKSGELWATIETQTFLFQGEKEIGVIEEDGRISELRILGAGNGQDVGASCAIEIFGKCYIPLHDYRGNIVSLINPETASVAETIRYSAYGEEEIFNDIGNLQADSISPWRFSSKRVDTNTGWVFFGRRWYDPKIGRWTTPDPLMFEDGINLYAYVKNRPLLFIDPDGTISTQLILRQNLKSPERKLVEYYDYDADANKNLFAIKNNSKVIPLEGIKTPGLMICFINGICNTEKDAVSNARKLSEYAGGREVQLIYNATHGKIYDINEAFMNLRGVCTTPVMHAHKLWDKFFEENGQNAHILLVSFSQGCAIGKNSVESYDPDRAQQIRVLGVGPFAFYNPDTCDDVQHLVGNDPVTKVDFENRLKYEDTINYLKPHPGESQWFDHKFQSETYADPIRDYVNKFFKDYTQVGVK